MAKKRLKKLKKAYDEAYQEAQEALLFSSTFKQWIEIQIVVNIVLFSFSAVLLIFAGKIPFVVMLVHIALALAIFFILVTIHELIHGAVAKLLGYKFGVESNTLFHIPKINMAYTSISVAIFHKEDSKWKRDRKIIGIAPHLLILPLGFLFIHLGYILQIYFFSILGTITVLGHVIALVLDMRVK